MGHLIGENAASYHRILEALKENRMTHICALDIRFGARKHLGITGEEQRPLTDRELDQLVEFYRYFKEFFTKKGLLPVSKLKE